MPVIPLVSVNLSHLLAGRAAENPAPELQSVICAFPLSGQYGPGSRILYYILVAACVLARKTEWLRNACLAAALIFPATAAIHGIVLAALHLDDAVDMDIYGAFQFCAIGILTAPATVRLSRTYFNNPGKSVLFLWTMLVIAGLLALTVEFFRSQSNPCTDDGSGQLLYRGSSFPYGNTTCGLTCSAEHGHGPYSPMRDGSADNVYVVPTPGVLTFGAAMLVAAACCIPGILSMVSLWDKILRTNFVKQFGDPDANELIDGTNGATEGGMKNINEVIRGLLSRVEIPVFGGAVLALIIVGELNFWSEPVRYETEPIANVGQWSNIAASVFAACGSLYIFCLETADNELEGIMPARSCNCTCHEHGSNHPGSWSDRPETAERTQSPQRTTTLDSNLHQPDTLPSHMPDTQSHGEDHGHGLGITRIDSSASSTTTNQQKGWMRIATALGTASPGRYDDRDFREGKATGFPEIPGELTRNPNLNKIKEQWGQPTLDGEDSHTPRGRRSRANSFNSISRPSSIGPRARSPQRSLPQPPMTPQPTSASFLGLPTTASPESTSDTAFPARPSTELEKTKSSGTVVTLHEGPNSPAIVLSSEEEPSEPSDSGAATPTATAQLPRRTYGGAGGVPKPEG